jgi:hypothetical protein
VKAVAVAVAALALVACASLDFLTVGVDETLVIDVTGTERFEVEGRRFRADSLVASIKDLADDHPNLRLRFRIPSALLGVDPAKNCFLLTGYRVRSAVLLDRQEFFEWTPGKPDSAVPTICSFITVGAR